MISKSIVLLHTTLKYLRLFVKSAKLQQIQHCKNKIYIQRKLHVEHFLKNTDCEMVAFWQENTLNKPLTCGTGRERTIWCSCSRLKPHPKH